MPVVPRAQPRVQAAPLPGVRVGTGTPAGAFGAAQPIDLSAPTQFLAGVVDRQRQEADQIKLQDRDTQLANLHTDVETQVTQMKGLDALGAKKAAQDAWEKGVAAIDGSDDHASDQVKTAFRARAQTYWTRLYGTVEAHTAQQLQVHDAQSTDAALANRVQGAAKDPSLAPQLAAETKALVTDYGRRQGWDAEQQAAEQTKRVSAVHLAAIDRLLTAGSDLAAQQYYTAHKGDVSGEDALKVEKALEEGSSRGESQRQADAILAGRSLDHTTPGLTTPGNIDLTHRPRVTNPDGSVSTVRSMSFEVDGKEVLVPTVTPDGKNLTDAQAIARYRKTGEHLGIFDSADAATAYAKQLHDAQAAQIAGTGDGTVPQGVATKPPTLTEAVALARQIKDPRVRDLTETRLRQTDAEQKAAQRDQSEQDMVTAGNLIDRQHSVTAIPPAMWARFTPAQKANLKNYAEGVVGGPEKQKTDLATWVSLRTMAGNPDTRDAFLKLDPMSYASKLSPADFKGIVELRDGLKKGDDRTAATLDDVGRHNGIISNTLHGIGMLIDPKTGKADKPEAAAIYRSVNDQVEALQQATKRKATDKEVQAITDELVTRHVVTSAPSIWDRFFVRDPETGPKRLYEMRPGDQLVITAADLKPDDRRAIVAGLRARGMPATEDAILATYRAHLESLVHRGPQ